MNNQELEDRLVDFAVQVINITLELPDTKAANHLSAQLLRSGTSPALNYGEARSGESQKDFIHKLQIVLKELRESIICIKIIHKSIYLNTNKMTEAAIKECNELISIFVKSVSTAKKNMESESQNNINQNS